MALLECSWHLLFPLLRILGFILQLIQIFFLQVDVMRCLSAAGVLMCGLWNSSGGGCGIVLVADPLPVIIALTFNGIGGNSAFSSFVFIGGMLKLDEDFPAPFIDKKQA